MQLFQVCTMSTLDKHMQETVQGCSVFFGPARCPVRAVECCQDRCVLGCCCFSIALLAIFAHYQDDVQPLRLFTSLVCAHLYLWVDRSICSLSVRLVVVVVGWSPHHVGVCTSDYDNVQSEPFHIVVPLSLFVGSWSPRRCGAFTPDHDYAQF